MARYVLFTYPDPDYAARYDALPGQEKRAEVDEVMAWFRRHRERIVGGEELDAPHKYRSVRRRAGEPVVTDGPFVEAKEMLGGFIIVEVDSLEQALAMAAEWPSLERGAGAVVQVAPVYERDAAGDPLDTSG